MGKLPPTKPPIMKSIFPLQLLFTLLGLLSLISLAPVVSGHNVVKFINHCPYDIYFWQVGPYKPDATWIDGSDNYRSMVPGGGGSIIHNMHNTEELGGGLSLKIRDLPYYAVAPAGIIQVEYHLEESKGTVWYDLSAVDCDHSVGPEDARYCPLIQGGVQLSVPDTPNGGCPHAYCSGTGCWNTYITEGGYPDEPSLMCWAGADLFVETCMENAGHRTFYGVDPKAPAPLNQDVPEPIIQPPPVAQPSVSLTGLKISPDGKCGPDVGYTCTGSQHGSCCSEYGFCGNSSDYCNARCQAAFGFCLVDNEVNSKVAVPQPSIIATITATSVIIQTSTATETETKSVIIREMETVERAAETMTVTVLHTITTTAVFTPPPLPLTTVSTRYFDKLFIGYPRRYAAAYVNM